jgi:uncharacterized protein HemY
MWPFTREERDEKKWDEMNKMVITLISEKKIDEAHGVAVELFNYSRKYYGKSHGNTATALNNLGFLGIMKKDFDKAESYLLMALQVSEKAYGKDSREVAVVDMNLAKLYVAKAREIQALEGVFKDQVTEEEEASARMGLTRQ